MALKITIEYKSYAGVPYCAYTFIEGEYFAGVSETSFEAAKVDLLKSVSNYKKRPVPPHSEDVEV